MSFILDALKKSEAERQQNRGNEFAAVPASVDSPSAPRWLWFLALLLGINIIALIYLATRPPALPTADSPMTAPATAAPEIASARRPTEAPAESPDRADGFAAQVAAARSSRSRREPAETAPQPEARTAAQADEAMTSADSPPATAATAPPAPTGNTLLLPSYTDLRLDGDAGVPALHIDIHVFSEDPADRFVFINMNKYRERQRLDEGPVIQEITPEGVVLEHRGTRFLLPRD